ncbi:kinase, partial [Streptomyces sp. B1866]|nr:kinase [Streptomyces sp. B1866]
AAVAPPRRLLDALGARGEGPADPARAWLAALPGAVRRQLAAWELTLERVAVPGGRGSLVALVRQADGTPAALRFPAPDPGAWRAGHTAGAEAAALARWDGHGAA